MNDISLRTKPRSFVPWYRKGNSREIIWEERLIHRRIRWQTNQTKKQEFRISGSQSAAPQLLDRLHVTSMRSLASFLTESYILSVLEMERTALTFGS